MNGTRTRSGTIERTEHQVGTDGSLEMEGRDARRGTRPDAGAAGGYGTYSAAGTASRALAVNRMNFRLWMLLLMPWMIVILVLAANAAILAIIRSQGTAIPEDSGNGVVAAIFFFALAVYASITTKHFPFALGLGVTRRDFYAGTALTALINGTVNAALVLVFAEIERATDGWGVHLEGFSVVFRATDNRATVFFAVLLTTLAFAAIGAFGGVVFLHWKVTGIFAVLVVLAAVLAIGAVVITWQQGWPAVGRFFVDSPFATLALGIPGAVTVLLAGGGYGLMRSVEA